MMADVFIGYASSDRDSPAALEQALEDAGFSVWWDRDLLPGRRFQSAIVKELKSAAAVVVVWSPGSVESEWVYSEARRARLRSTSGPPLTWLSFVASSPVNTSAIAAE